MKFKLYSIFIISSLYLFGCSFRSDLFIQNFKNDDIQFKIVYNIKIDSTWHKKHILKYVNHIIDPRSFNSNKPISTLDFQTLNDSTIVIKIPKNSTSRIAAETNMGYLNKIESIEFNNKKLSIEEFYNTSVGNNTYRIFKIKSQS